MRVGSLFTGYGGLDMAVGGELVWYAEIEKAACQVLAAHHLGIPNLGDIIAINWADVQPVDILTGGYPCQPFSHAGNRKGKNDERHLWPYVLTAIRAIRPRYAILENVSGHLSLGFDSVLTDLAEIGWSCEWATFRASDVGAPHRRERLFIVAYSDGERLQGHDSRGKETQTRGNGLNQQCAGSLATDTINYGLQHTSLRLEPQQGQAATQGHWGDAADTDSSSSETFTRRQRSRDTRRLQLVERGGSVSDNRQQPNPVINTDSGFRDGWGQKVTHVRQQLAKQSDAQPSGISDLPRVDWGKYAPAIRRWESVLDRLAPAPTVERKDKRRLNPQFVEWMMGLPDGWVTGHGLSAAQELKMLGNGVVPQQARAAITQLMQRVEA